MLQNKFDNLSNKNISTILLVITFFFILFFINPCVQIDAGHRGIILNLGAVSDKILEEGIHFQILLPKIQLNSIQHF